jgi:hypothetical protein
MQAVNWDAFAELTGAAESNFEKLCRALVRLHYGRHGDFFALANQPGVEFHLKLTQPCSLGGAGRWFGWQCRWYDLRSGRAIGTTRRKKIEEALRKTEAEVPGITDWVLWTRYPLTASDQQWYHALRTPMRLHLWTAADAEDLLSGPAEILRGTFFGDFVLTDVVLQELHALAIAPVKRRWQPEVHLVVNAERSLRRMLGSAEAWSKLKRGADRLWAGAADLTSTHPPLTSHLAEQVDALAAVARAGAAQLAATADSLDRGDLEMLRQELQDLTAPGGTWDVLLRRLRAARHPVVLSATNLVADLHVAYRALSALYRLLGERFVAVVADAGCGKTELAAQFTSATSDRPAGIFLHGRSLQAGASLDDLASSVVVHGRPFPSFEGLLASLDAAGRRTGRRLPLIIDGLNEAEDPRDWQAPLGSAMELLPRYPYVLVVCTLRSAFAEEALPDGAKRLTIPSFERDAAEAVKRYFRHYKIDPADAELPWGLLRHPLTLRLFCEVANPERKVMVGVEAMPGSLTAIFDRYLDQVAERIARLAPRSRRYFESDVRSALDEIGAALWDENARSLEIGWLRRRLCDQDRAWNESIVTALENDGVLFRVPGERPGSGEMSVIYDALGGHLIADAILARTGPGRFAEWIREEENRDALSGAPDKRHPLADDAFVALAGLTPRRLRRVQLWSVVDEPSRTEALYEAAKLDRSYLDADTVSELCQLVVTKPSGRRDLLTRLWVTRAARSHPLDATFLDAALRSMPLVDRDLRWSEWIRANERELLDDLVKLESRWRENPARSAADTLRARWVMWTLTSTARLLRDQGTKSLYWFGYGDPDALFELALDSLEINDPYIPERMLAACYGLAMAFWADPRGSAVRASLPHFAHELVSRMFVPGAPNSTRHVLTRDYALGVITVARMIDSTSIAEEQNVYLVPPFAHLPSPFPLTSEIAEDVADKAGRAIHMDFGNYTIGRLIPDRRNYDYANPTYQQVRRQIEHRILELGYSEERFGKVDGSVGEESWRLQSHRTAGKTDRYGKKYSWIAYFEMYGLRLDEAAFRDSPEDTRPSDVDIDPSFPEPPRTWRPELPEIFAAAPTEFEMWVAHDTKPDYRHLLTPQQVDGVDGPWVLLNGYIEQSSESDGRRVFTFLRGVLTSHKRVAPLIVAFNSLQHPGNRAIPDNREEHYTYAGEIPWSVRFGAPLRDRTGKAKRDIQEAFVTHNGVRWVPGIEVEIPITGFSWESYHSDLNEGGNIEVPAPALCDRLKLVNHQGEWDLYDANGKPGSIYREFQSEADTSPSHLLYLRSDLAARYLRRTRQTLIWLNWGERGFEYRTLMSIMDELQALFASDAHIHKQVEIWQP